MQSPQWDLVDFLKKEKKKKELACSAASEL